LILAGPVEATSQLHHLLPKLRRDPHGSRLGRGSSLRVSEEAERNGEIRLVEGLLSDAAKAARSDVWRHGHIAR